MNKGLLFAGALLLATPATAALAQVPGYGWGGYGYGYGYGGPHSYAEYARQLRACRQHARLHAELDREHAMEHMQGLAGPGDHYDLHDSLDEAHDAYHQDHPRADMCDGMGYGGYAAPTYPYGGGYPSGYGYWSFGFGR